MTQSPQPSDKQMPVFDYEIGQNVYAVWHDNGHISRYKVGRIKVEYRERDVRVMYYDGYNEVPRATGKTSWSQRACSIFLDRPAANRAAKPYLEAYKQKQIERLKSEIAAKQSELSALTEAQV